MTSKEANALKPGESVAHARYGISSVLLVLRWNGAFVGVIISPDTANGRQQIEWDNAGKADDPYLESNPRRLTRHPMEILRKTEHFEARKHPDGVHIRALDEDVEPPFKLIPTGLFEKLNTSGDKQFDAECVMELGIGTLQCRSRK